MSRLRVRMSAILVALLVVTLAAGGRAQAAFFAATQNAGSSFTAGTGFGTGNLLTWGDTSDMQLAPTQLGDAATWTSAAVGDHFGCGLQTGGSLWCWGTANGSGQQGTGDTAMHRVPQQAGAATWSQVATGTNHACGVRADGTLWCWGANAGGQLGTGGTTPASTPQQVSSTPATGWAAVATGNQFTCAVRTDATMYCFGLNQVGQLGIGTITPMETTPTQVTTPATLWSSVSLGYQHACALRTDQTLHCWGDGGSGRLGRGNTTNSSAPQQVTGVWTGVGLGTDHSCGIQSDGTLWCWGNNGSGRLGANGTTASNLPVKVGAATTWRAVAGGLSHTCGTRTDGTLWCWGSNVVGQLGLGDTTDRTTPAQVGTDTTWTRPAPGSFPRQNCAVRTGGTLWCWGDTGAVRWTPVQAVAGTWRSAAVGEKFTCGVRADGTLWCWGWNGAGRLGLGDTTDRWLPTQVGTATTWRQVTAGLYHACAIGSDTTLWCWGANGDGQVGTGGTTDRTTPFQVTTPAATGWSAVSAGARFTCATRTDGTLYCFGRNLTGETGQGSYASPQPTPAQVTAPAATGWASVSTGYQHACGLRTDRTLYCWGDGGSGRLGQGDATNTPTPLQVAGTAWWVLSAGTDHTCAIRTDGTLWCWGAGGAGRLGLGTVADTLSPARVGAAITWRAVRGGTAHTCGIQADNSLWCWGTNQAGQLGLGSAYGQQTSPVRLPGVTGRPPVAGPGSSSSGLIAYQ